MEKASIKNIIMKSMKNVYPGIEFNIIIMFFSVMFINGRLRMGVLPVTYAYLLCVYQCGEQWSPLLNLSILFH